MVKAACSIVLKDFIRGWKKNKTTEEREFHNVSNFFHMELETNFLMMLLMVRCTTAGVLYSARTNADNKMLSNKNGLKKSMYEHATSGEDQESFNSSPLVATFYNIVRLEDMCPDSPRLASIAKEKVIITKIPDDSPLRPHAA